MNTLNIPHLPWFAERSCVSNANEECVFAAVNGHVYRDNSQEDYDTAALVAAAPELYDVLNKLVADAEQGWFEDWLQATEPSGDCESVESKWKESAEYLEFADEMSAAINALAKARGES